jgi:RNA polymerase sigma-70 factor (ECF subfamily)
MSELVGQAGRVQCVVRADAGLLLAPEVMSPAGVKVVVEGRRAERRAASDRRVGPTEEQLGAERRRIHNRQGRRAGERRAPVVPVPHPADLPRAVLDLADRLVFLRRMPPAAQEVEDLETARLVIDLQAGKPGAFDEIYERYVSRVYRYMRIALADEHEAEDATHEIFVKLLDALPDYELRAVPFRIWLFRIVRNYTINHIRKHRRISVMAPDQVNRRIEDAPAHAATDAVIALDDDELLRLIACLPITQRQVIVLRYVMDFDLAEVAKILGRSPNAVSMLQQRAFAILRSRLIETGRAPEARTAQLPMRRYLRDAVVTAARRLALTY